MMNGKGVSVRHKWGLCFVCICLLSLGFAFFSSHVQARDQEVIRVGRFPYDDQVKVDANGTYSGYGFDYLQEIARYTGWRYEFVDASWSESLELLRRGEIDLMGAVMRSPEREAVFGFSKYPMGSGYGMLATTLGNDVVAYDEFRTFGRLRIGALKDNLQTAHFRTYCLLHDIAPTIIEYPDQAALNEALAAGEIDSVVLSDLLHEPNLRVIASFGENNAYFATDKTDISLLFELNEAMRQILLRDPYFNSTLSQKHNHTQPSDLVSLTRDEFNFARNTPPIPCVYFPDSPPFTQRSAGSDEVSGVAVDICKLLEERTGLRFVWLHPRSADEAVEMLRDGRALLMPAKYDDPGWASRNNLDLTPPYLNGQMVAIRGDQTRADAVVALYAQGPQSLLLDGVIPAGARIDAYDSVLACVEAVRRGDADLAFVNSSIASYLGNNPKYAHLKTAPLYGYSADVTMAISRHADPQLLSILDKGLHSLSDAQINQIALSHMRMGQQGRMATFFYLHPAESVTIVSMVLLSLVLTLAILLHLRQKNSRMLQKALYTDELTGYPNYHAMAREFPALIRKHPAQYALIYLDIHQFKVINDTFGYQVGDQVLIATSDVLSGFVQAQERFARLYADTFALLLCFSELSSLKERIAQLSQQLAQLPVTCEGAVNPLFCAGVYPLPEGFDDLDQACDRANYAKDSLQSHFSNRFVFYDDLMRNQLLAEKELERYMQPALDRGEFLPYYQPKINAITGRVSGAEALVRWNHPEKGLLLPATFLPFYEKNGFIMKIDLFVFERVCQDLARWLRAGNEAVPVSINFSRRHIREGNLPQQLREITERYQVPTRLFEVEITETEELENLDAALAFADRLKQYGFRISIDDYGTGYSSISFLQQLPLDTLKLDRKFILNAMHSGKAQDLMRYLVAAMQHNEVDVICEGVETLEQRDFVVRLNCRFIQGYFYAAALPRLEFEAYLRAHGCDRTDRMRLLPITALDAGRWIGAEEFLNEAAPSWVACRYLTQGYPIHYVSPNFLSGMGYSELEFEAEIGDHYSDWVHPEDLSIIQGQIDATRSGESKRSLPYRLRKRDGSYLWIREISRQVLTEDGQEALLCVCTDISDLVSLQAEKLRLIDSVPGGVGELLLTADGPIILQATDRFYQVIGHTREQMQLIDFQLMRIICAPDIPHAANQLQALIGGEANGCNCTFRMRHADDSMHWVSFQGSVFTVGEQLRITVIIYSNDTEVQAKRDAETIRAKLELALTLNAHAVFEYNVQTRCICAQTGFAPYGLSDDVALDPERDLIRSGCIHPDDLATLHACRKQIAAGEPHTSFEMRIHGNMSDPDSPYIWVRVTLSAIFDEDGLASRAVGVVENINHEKSLRQSLRQEAQFYKAFTESSLMAYEFNLTQNTIQRINGTRGFRLRELSERLPEPNCYTALLEAALPMLIAPEDREEYARFTSRARLLELHRSGVSEFESEYRRQTPDGSLMWTSVFTHLTLDPFSGDLIGYVYHRDIHARKLAEQGLVEKVARDPLTGILNRTAAEQSFTALLQHASPDRIQAFLMLDFDHFKKLNDTCGHLNGDKSLIRLAQLLQTQLRADDLVARIGGDEFAVLLKNLPDEKHALSIARKLSRAIGQIGEELNLEMRTGASIGIALAPRHGLDFESLYRSADQAMYLAKGASGERIVLYNDASEPSESPS